MTVYTTPDFEAEALDLDHVPERHEIYPDDLTQIVGPQDAEVRLVGTRHKYKVGIQVGEEDDGSIGASIWTLTEVANENLAEHAQNGGILEVTLGAISFTARIIISRHGEAATLGELFRYEPLAWGLRGDPHLWAEMRDYLADWLLPLSIEELDKRIRYAFLSLTGASIDSTATIFLEKYDKGGMSSGHIDPAYWRDNALPQLREQLAFDRDWKRPPCLNCGSTNVARIVFGEPGFEMMEAYDRGDIVLGGCCVTEDDPEWRCSNCDHEWS
jgi:hypothetical protein